MAREDVEMDEPTVRMLEAVIALAETHEAWTERAACGVPEEDFWFADRRRVALGQRVCSSCPVRQRCLDYALDNGIDHGVWGGESSRSRTEILRRRRDEVTS